MKAHHVRVKAFGYGNRQDAKADALGPLRHRHGEPEYAQKGAGFLAPIAAKKRPQRPETDRPSMAA